MFIDKMICEAAQRRLNKEGIVLSNNATKRLQSLDDKTQVGYVTNPWIEHILQQIKYNILHGSVTGTVNSGSNTSSTNKSSNNNTSSNSSANADTNKKVEVKKVESSDSEEDVPLFDLFD